MQTRVRDEDDGKGITFTGKNYETNDVTVKQ